MFKYLAVPSDVVVVDSLVGFTMTTDAEQVYILWLELEINGGITGTIGLTVANRAVR